MKPIVFFAALAALAFPADAAKLTISRRNRVCVIGAGAAGLGAANTLRAAGIPLVVLEARNRAGGRVWSESLGSGQGGDQPASVDLGAGWLEGDGSGNPMYNLFWPHLTNGETVLSKFDAGEDYFVEGGENPTDPMRGWDDMEDLIADEQDGDDDRDPNLGTLINRATSGEGMSAAEKLKVEWQATIGVTNEYAADPSQLSGWNFDAANDEPGNQRLWKNGYITAFQGLLPNFDIKYGTVVSRVSYRANAANAVVTTNKGNYRCSRVLVTVPLGWFLTKLRCLIACLIFSFHQVF